MLRVFLLQPYELLFIAARDDNDYNDYDSGISKIIITIVSDIIIHNNINYRKHLFILQYL